MYDSLMKKSLFWSLTGLLLLLPSAVHAFCGFYVAGGDASLFNDATQVVLMRSGTTTVMSMQNNYQGPAEDFAMVVPVPMVLQQENVKTLSAELFSKIDQLTAPRLVEYWEHDPCEPNWYRDDLAFPTIAGTTEEQEGGVTVEAAFQVGEYDIVILSTDNAGALNTWLTDNEYNIPEGADQYLDPYVQAGTFFFVAKVAMEKVTYKDGNAVLSPLRMQYENEGFGLPIRLGMMNSSGTQDIIVYVLGANQRYEVANYPNAFIATNINVLEAVKDDFGTFYKALFAETIAQTPNAVVTEYSWDASSCDPCPGPTLDQADFLTLGADVLEVQGGGWVITRLHARFEKDAAIADLIFQAADPVVGGRERYDEEGVLETGAKTSSVNNFQGRYIIRHPWDGPTDCEDAVFDRWGGEDGSVDPGAPSAAVSPNTAGESVAADSIEGLKLENMVDQEIPELNIVPVAAKPGGNGGTTPGGSETEAAGGSSGGLCSNSPTAPPIAGLIILGFALLGLMQRKRSWRV
jgi:hypothetical protein